MKTEFPHLFQPIQIGNLKLRNRLVMPAMGTRYCAFGGYATEQLTGYLAERASGGAGLVIMEMTAVTANGRISNYSPGLYDDRYIPGLKKVTDAVKKAGSGIAIQLAHGGSGSFSAVTGVQPVAPSPVPRFKGEMPRELSTGEIETLVEAFAAAAERAKTAGFDAIELHLAHDYLLDQFLSPITNRRTDEYGGDVNGRAKFALDILKEIKKENGKDFPVICRLTGNQFIPGGFSLEDCVAVAEMLEAAGADAIHVTGGSIETVYMSAPPMAIPEGCLVFLSEAVKKTVHIPVIAVGKIRTPDLAEKILDEGKADLIAVGRGFIADAEFGRKAFENRSDRIRPCISCNNPFCHGRTGKNLDMGCTVNASVGREDFTRIVPAEKKKTVLIIGAGPAGLEAARVSALRGHRVTICEKSQRIGGQLCFGSVPPAKQELARLVDYFAVQIDSLGIELRTECSVGAKVLKDLRPDVVIAATGGKFRVPEIPGMEGRSINAVAVLSGKTIVGRKVAVIGGGDVGCETAEYLAQENREVTIFEMLPEPSSEYMWWAKKLLYDRLANLKVNLLTQAKVVEVTENSIVYERGGIRRQSGPVDSIVLAAGLEPDMSITPLLEQMGVPYFTIGDSRKCGSIASAVREGFETALRI